MKDYWTPKLSLSFQKNDTLRIKSYVESLNMFRAMRNKKVFEEDAVLDEILVNLRMIIERELDDYRENYGIDFESGERVLANSGKESGSKNEDTGDANKIFA